MKIPNVVLGSLLVGCLLPQPAAGAQRESPCAVLGAPDSATTISSADCHLEVLLCSKYERILAANPRLEPKFFYLGEDLGVNDRSERFIAKLCTEENVAIAWPCESPESAWRDRVEPGDRNPAEVPAALLRSSDRSRPASRYVIVWEERRGGVRGMSTPFTVTSKSGDRRLECEYDW